MVVVTAVAAASKAVLGILTADVDVVTMVVLAVADVQAVVGSDADIVVVADWVTEFLVRLALEPAAHFEALVT